MKVSNQNTPLRILLICASGMGNALFFTPTLVALRKVFPRARIDLLTIKAIAAQPVRGSTLVNEIRVFSDKDILNKLKIIIELRKRKYDYSITAFPSNKCLFNIFAFLIGAKNRVTHRYKIAKIKTLSFLQNKKILVDVDIHDVDQNISLLKVFGVDPTKEKRKLIFFIFKANKRYAEKFLETKEIKSECFLIGIHPGAGGINGWQGPKKRWPVEKFAALSDRLINERGAKILLFGGPEELVLKQKLTSLAKNKNNIYLVNASLKNAAALIRKCKLFISNDSGLMNVAIALGVKTIGIFGPTNYKRTAPYGEGGYIVRKNLSCSPCLRYPFQSTSSKIDCPKNFECLREIEVEDVINLLRRVDEEG